MTNEDVYRITKQDKWSNVIKTRRISWLGHLLRLPPDIPASKALTFCLKPNKLKRGRPKLTWTIMMKKELENLHLTFDTARIAAQDTERVLWWWWCSNDSMCDPEVMSIPVTCDVMEDIFFVIHGPIPFIRHVTRPLLTNFQFFRDVTSSQCTSPKWRRGSKWIRSWLEKNSKFRRTIAHQYVLDYDVQITSKKCQKFHLNSENWILSFNRKWCHWRHRKYRGGHLRSKTFQWIRPTTDFDQRSFFCPQKKFSTMVRTWRKPDVTTHTCSEGHPKGCWYVLLTT